jgi:nucleoid DNA-binding protein
MAKNTPIRKKDIISKMVQSLKEQHDLTISAKQCSKILDVFKDTALDFMEKGNSLQISGFLKFDIKHQKKRKVYHPQTKKYAEKPASTVAKVSLSKSFKIKVKDALNK